MAEETDRILEGWKEIGWAWGLRGVSEQTIRRKAIKYNMPFLRWGDPVRGRPWITLSTLRIWWANLIEKAMFDLKKEGFFIPDSP